KSPVDRVAQGAREHAAEVVGRTAPRRGIRPEEKAQHLRLRMTRRFTKTAVVGVALSQPGCGGTLERRAHLANAEGFERERRLKLLDHPDGVPRVLAGECRVGFPGGRHTLRLLEEALFA